MGAETDRVEAIPPSALFAEPWLKQLVTHEYRHAVQYGNLHRRFMKWVGYVVGQQAGLLSSVLLPIWFLEGDAVMNETQMASFGRALQPPFTIEYRAYLTEGTKKFPLDKWFCGSYKNYIPITTSSVINWPPGRANSTGTICGRGSRNTVRNIPIPF